jgi:hypothetical protein
LSWFEQVSQYIDDNLEDFISHFFPQSNQLKHGKGITLNPAPCCGHNDCFSFATNKPVGGCFSCGAKGTRIQMVEEVWGVEAGREELEKWSTISFNRKYESETVRENKQKENRLNEVYKWAIQFYNMQLFSQDPVAELAFQKQIGTNIANGERKHQEEILKEFQIGLALDNYGTFEKMMANKGYTEEELTEARKLTWIPPFYYVYPYFDAKGNLIRINTKPFKRMCLGTKKADGKSSYNCTFETYDTSKKTKKAHETETGHRMSADVYSTGEKDDAFYGSPEVKGRKKFLILVEGEDDVITTYEELLSLESEYVRDFTVRGLGGGVKEGTFTSPFFRQFERIYEAFDNDEAGDKYRKQLNEEAPDIPVYHIEIDLDFSDIDEYIKSPMENRMSLADMIDHAEYVENKHVFIERENGLRHAWNAKNRSFHIHFEIDRYNFSQSQLEGIVTVFSHGELTVKKTGGIDRMKLDGPLGPAKLALSTHLEKYYNDVAWDKNKPTREFSELIDMIKHTKNYAQVVKQIAWYLHNSNEMGYERLFQVLRNKVSDQKVIAEILKEVNGFANSEINPHSLFPKINLSQYFNVTNNDAYFYFSRVVKDGDIPKLVPCLLSNRKEELRLDLLKRKDPQCLLLIQNKYEMPFEVETAVMDPIDVSLQPYWVDKWKNNEISEEDMKPSVLIGRIEDFIRKCYYLEESVLKVLSLWIYATYFYMLFKSGFPYLMFTGPKGTGKSTLDTLVYLLAINAKIALDMSESALYRTITFEGGTFILDEVEHLTDKKVVDSNGYAKILKGGYSDNAYVYRTNMDKGGASERFSVFGPKVISNINGIEDVIADRCIYIRTFRVEESKLRGLEDPQLYKEEKRPEVHSITSLCALSALTNFKTVSESFNAPNSTFETGSARLSQIMKPLMTMARFVGGDYEQHLMHFYNTEVKEAKEEIANSTIEGMIRSVLKRITRELIGLEPDKWATTKHEHAYDHPITYSPQTKTFEVDNLHIKVLCEEMNSGERIDLKVVTQTLKSILGPTFDVTKSRRSTTATIADENLQKALDGKRQIRVYRYMLQADMFVTGDDLNKALNKTTETASMF